MTRQRKLADRLGLITLVVIAELSAVFSQTTPPPPVRRLPPRIAPAKDVGTLKQSKPAAKRGLSCAKASITLAAFGPDSEYGTTTESKPRLFWYISEGVATDCQAIFTLMCDPSEQENPAACPAGTPPFERKIANPIEPGIHEVEPRPELRPGVIYRWYISVGREREGRSGDNVDGAYIRLIAASTVTRKPWYDSLADAYDRSLEGDRGELDRLLHDVGFGPPNR